MENIFCSSKIGGVSFVLPAAGRARKLSNVALTAAALFFAGFAADCQAAVISGSVVGPVGATVYDLNALGGSDWAYWNTSSNPATGVPSNSFATGSLIGNMVAVAGIGLRGSASATRPTELITYTGGIAPVSNVAGGPITGLFNQSLDTVGAGVGLSIILPTIDSYLVTVWASAFGGEGTLSALLGAASYTDIATVTGGSGANKPTFVYSLLVTPDNPGDALNLSLVLSNDFAGANSNVVISGVAVSAPIFAPSAGAVPEAGTLALLSACMGLLGVGVYRRRGTEAAAA